MEDFGENLSAGESRFLVRKQEQRFDGRAEPFRIGACGQVRGDGPEDVPAMEGAGDVAGAKELGLVECCLLYTSRCV